jgi:hypothetical protein
MVGPDLGAETDQWDPNRVVDDDDDDDEEEEDINKSMNLVFESLQTYVIVY